MSCREYQQLIDKKVQAWKTSGKGTHYKPTFKQKDFLQWGSKQIGPLRGKPAASSRVLVKVALNVSDKCWDFIGDKYSCSKEVLLLYLEVLSPFIFVNVRLPSLRASALCAELWVMVTFGIGPKFQRKPRFGG